MFKIKVGENEVYVPAAVPMGWNLAPLIAQTLTWAMILGYLHQGGQKSSRPSFINPDLTLYLQRLPRGEWVCLDAVTWPEGQGVGLAESELFDADGRLGRALQGLLLERRS